METVLKDNQNLLRSPENLNGSWRNLGIISKEDRNLGQGLAENSCESRHNLGQTIPAESRNLYESVMSLVFGGCTLIFIDFWGSAKVVALIFVLFPILSVVEVLIKARAAKLYLVIKAIFPSLYSLFDFFFFLFRDLLLLFVTFWKSLKATCSFLKPFPIILRLLNTEIWPTRQSCPAVGFTSQMQQRIAGLCIFVAGDLKRIWIQSTAMAQWNGRRYKKEKSKEKKKIDWVVLLSVVYHTYLPKLLIPVEGLCDINKLVDICAR